ncbi:TetR family transcriptional regulator [Actinacidiphila bryophytorum]|uniref:Transcriptional regulator, TetR family n=1 Tax=Actinacidiphila bryophytorum TaxID=1436133 RepID=A0A9W4H135_9ACTN|nr:TetR family transcriptional regulator [Actinacidiphila bryophytorum]MBM9434880.1 TetR family transcriptional regulator [Actinacidiphila bryophytorum]CAG7640952.1 Transcriptional regulator, TetR family [Actinacidiphila bryophytorum]
MNRDVAASKVIGRDAEATRRRLLDAATREFAAYGIAGSRVDRIAAEARSNKAQIYHYFGSKDGLFDAVFDAMCRETVDAVPIDADDLPEYAGRLHDSYVERPWAQRLATWYRLERAGSGALLPVVLDSNAAKIRAVAEAQEAGRLTTRFLPAELLGLVLHLSGFWSSNVPEYDAVVPGGDDSAAHRREVVVTAVAALLHD